MTRRIYMDNAATSFPKPPGVLEAITRYANDIGASPGRGGYAEAKEAARLMHQCRQRINTLLGGDPDQPEQVIFTLNTTDALNLAIRGIVGHARLRHPHRTPHVITTALDHNSVLRPFNELTIRGDLTQTRIPCDPSTGRVDPTDIRDAITPDTRLIACVHGSNVSGTLQPIRDIGRIAREAAIPFLVDAAQTLGHLPLNVEHDLIDLLAFPGHKGLLGPLGTGGLYIRPGLERSMVTIREGGTGSISELDTQPTFLPDRFEPGSHNAIGLIGLSEGVAYLLDKTVDALWQHEQSLIQTMLEGLEPLESVRLLGPPGLNDRCGVFSLRLDPALGYQDPSDLSLQLEHDFGILTRSGIHCAPHAHATFGTRDSAGATRFSLGPFLSAQDVRYATDALAHLCQRQLAAA